MTFYIQNVETGYVLDIKGANTSSHGEIIMYSFHGKSNQLWTYQNGMICSKLNGMVLDVNQSAKKVITYPSHGKPNQKWHFDNDGAVRSDIGLVLDVSAASRNEGAEVIAYSKHGGRNQMFRRIYVPHGKEKFTYVEQKPK